jgi:hypothetical protein
MSCQVQSRIATILKCQQESFPQVYLGLALSNVSLHSEHGLATLLNHVGRQVLVNSEHGLATYAMQAMALLVGDDEPSSRRRMRKQKKAARCQESHNPETLSITQTLAQDL